MTDFAIGLTLIGLVLIFVSFHVRLDRLEKALTNHRLHAHAAKAEGNHPSSQ